MATDHHILRQSLLALTGGAVLTTVLTACAPPPVRRQPEQGPVVADPVSVSPELERAPPEPDPQPGAAPETRVAQASTPPPARSRPESTPPQPQPQATPTPPDDWWLHKPAPVPGRVRLVASATGQTLREARRAAVDEGLKQLREAVGEDPRDVQYELTSVQRDTPGQFRGYVLVSCAASAPSKPN
ncbi:MAG: hypothetical protein R3B57_02510 [Phycisphaerales bacterium]